MLKSMVYAVDISPCDWCRTISISHANAIKCKCYLPKTTNLTAKQHKIKPKTDNNSSWSMMHFIFSQLKSFALKSVENLTCNVPCPLSQLFSRKTAQATNGSRRRSDFCKRLLQSYIPKYFFNGNLYTISKCHLPIMANEQVASFPDPSWNM